MRLTICLMCLALQGCATQGYQGAELPENQVALVYFFAKKGIDISNLRVGTTRQGTFDLGVRVLPGRTQASADYRIDEESCYSGDYYCSSVTHYGQCSAEIRAEAGQQYNIEITSAGNEAFISVINDETGEVAGSGKCRESI